jgi:hypothetical protein
MVGTGPGRRVRRAVALTALLVACAFEAEARVLLIVVDGLDAREVTDESTPALARAWRTSPWCPGTRSRASMPTRTNSNHATLMTGVEPEMHGITGNAVWDRRTRSVRKLGAASDLETETIFTIARREARGLRTAAAVGKPKLGLMFSADGTRQTPPDELWDARAASDASRDEVTGYAYDATTLAAARSVVEHAATDFLFINLSDVDRVSHGLGPYSPQAVETRRRTDAALGTFLEWLATRADWKSTTVVITADHGFDAITNPPIRFADALKASGLRGLVAVGDGGVGHVYVPPGIPDGRAIALLASARRIALETPGIEEALYRRPNPRDGDSVHTVASVHPDWHIDHERSGDLILVAKLGWQVVDGSAVESQLIGNHGGPAERAVPAIVVGGATIGPGADCDDVRAADLGRTVQACLGLPEARQLDGRAIPTAARGRVLTGICPTPTGHSVTLP